ncbi:MAG: hypothetical protein ACRD50_07000 [Candidatus Acidiferrales bacterium]
MSKARIKEWVWVAIAIAVALPMYFVRELLAAELIFMLIFGMALVVGGILYLVAEFGEKFLDGVDWMLRAVLPAAWRRVQPVEEEVSKKPFHHPHSESVQ